MTMTPPDDIIHDVVAFDRGSPESKEPGVTRLDQPADDEEDEIRSLENQCR
jgi:hypothetical protein